MYKPYYKLSFDPFQLQHESAFFWAGKWHNSMLEELRAAVLEKRGFFALTSPEGFGKTCLAETLVERLGDRVDSSFITLKNDNIINFYNTILTGFGVGVQVTTKIQFYLQITDCLQKIKQRNSVGLLVVDNAHLLSQELLEELRHVSNIENDGVKLINILLVGNESVKVLINEAQNSALRQKIMFHGEIPALSDGEIREYVEHRLRIAGATARVFNDNAFKQLSIYTDGVVKVLNILCETALTLGCKRSKKPIDDQIILDAASKLKLQPSEKRTDMQGKKRKKSPENVAHEENYIQSDRFSSPKKKKNWTLTVIVSSLVSIVCLFYLFPELLKFPLPEADSTVEMAVVIPEVNTEIEVTQVHDENKENIKNTLITEDVQDDESVASSVFDVGDENTKISSEIVLNSEKLQDEINSTSNIDTIKNENQTDTTVAGENIVNEAIVLDNDSGGEASNAIELQIKGDVDSDVIVPPSIDGSEGELDPRDEILRIAPVSSKIVLYLLEGKLILETKPNSSEITKEGLRELNMFAARLLQHPKATIQVEGYISSKNNSLENIKLSERRANIVRDYLLAQGIGGHQIVVKGMGNQNPRASNDTYDGRKKNRRVEISVVSDLCHPAEQE